MLHEFLLAHRDELIRNCRQKVAARFAPADVPDAVEYGVPLFIHQLIDALRDRPSASAADVDLGEIGQRIPFPAEISRSAALHGAALMRRGFTVDQVVHEYGDICQAITEMAIDLKCPIDPDDFRILNGCLDNAIAGAVTAFAQGHQSAIDALEVERHERRSDLREEHRQLVEIAIQAFTAIRTGGLGVAGATGALLMHALTELQSLCEQQLGDGDKSEAAASLRRASKRDQAS
jgi:hypothetical protein